MLQASHPTPTLDPIIKRLNEKLTFEQKEIFIQSFAMYLKYDEEKDFVVNLDDIWKIMGYSSKGNAKVRFDSLVKKKVFTPKTDFIEVTCSSQNEDGVSQLAFEISKAKKGGQNAIEIRMSVLTFKKFCLKSEKADWIHDYYLAMEKVIFDYTKEQIEKSLKQQQAFGKEKALLQSFVHKSVNYLFLVDKETTDIKGIELKDGEELGKFGESHKLDDRILKAHKKQIGANGALDFVIETPNAKQLETDFKLENRSRMLTVTLNGKKQTEVLLFNESYTPDDARKSLERLNEKFISQVKMQHFEKMQELELKKLAMELEDREREREERQREREERQREREDKQREREFQLEMMKFEMIKLKIQSKG